MSYGSSATPDKSLPPGPSLAPKAQALRWIGQPYEFLRDCARAYGDVFTLDMGLEEGKYVVVSHPDAIRSVLTAEPGALRVCNNVLAPMLGPRSLLILDGAAHLRERRLLMPSFQHRSIGTYGVTIREALREATEGWSAGHEVLAQDVLQDLSFEVILRVMFGDAGGEPRQALKREVMGLLNDRRLGLGLLGRAGESATMPALGAFWQKIEHVRDVALELVEATRDRVADDTMMAQVARATDEHGHPITNEHLRDEVLTLLVTGHETTTTGMAWGLYWVAQRGEVRARLREELGALGPDPDPMAVAALPYLDATCKEILRIYPIVPSLFRQVVDRPFAAGGWIFEPGTFVSPSIYLTHHRGDIYANPDSFEPARFLERTFSPYEYLPFGGGSRRCVGMHLAVFEMKIVLAGLVRAYDYDIVAPRKVTPARRFVTVAPGNGLRVRITAVR
jgi:cytochrome P450 family 110